MLSIEEFCYILTFTNYSGKLVQIEYALNAVRQGVTAIGIKCGNGVVLATERKANSPLIRNDTNIKVEYITPNIGMTYSGMGPDFRVLVDRARKLAHTNYKRIYNEYPPVKIMVQEIAKVMQESTQSGGIRPFGVSLLVGGYDESNEGNFNYIKLILVEVISLGKLLLLVNLLIWLKHFGKRWNDNLQLEDGIHVALLALKECIDGELNGDNLILLLLVILKNNC